MDLTERDVDNPLSSKMMILLLVLSAFPAMTPSLLSGLLLVDISETFQSTVGVVGQIQTVSFIVAFVTALLLGGLTIKFRSRTLLIIGLLLLVISAIGCSLASSLTILFLFYAVSGAGSAIIVPIAVTLVAEIFPIERRSRIIGLVMASVTFSMIIGSPIIGYISEVSGWRMAFIAWAFPLSLIGLISAFLGLPKGKINASAAPSQPNLREGFQAITGNRSALSCLVSTALFGGSVQAMFAYSSSFLRETFQVSIGFTYTVFLVATILAFLANLVISQMISFVGRKRLISVSSLCIGLCVIFFIYSTNYLISASFLLLAFMFIGFLFPSSNALVLEQIPEYRGSMMSINAASEKLGSAICVSLGGYLLIQSNWQSVGLFIGGRCLVASLIIILFVNDRTGYNDTLARRHGKRSANT